MYRLSNGYYLCLPSLEFLLCIFLRATELVTDVILFKTITKNLIYLTIFLTIVINIRLPNHHFFFFPFFFFFFNLI